MQKGHEVKVLDHGYVRLIDYMGSDEAVIEAARMSTGKGFEGWDKDQKLLTFLYKNLHMTPFECGGEMMIEVFAPIFVFREWMRHRTQSYNEFSARYAVMPNIHYVPSMERMKASLQSADNKQGSADGLDEHVASVEQHNMADDQATVYESYERAIGKGVSKEVARINTPVSRYSKMRAKTDLRNWLGFLMLRLAPNAQWEIRQYAEAVAVMVKDIWPRTYELFEEHDRYGAKFSRGDLEVIRGLLSIPDGKEVLADWLEERGHKDIARKLGPPKIAAVVCLTTGDSTLLGFNRKYGWGWPGGKVESNELIEEAAVRELREETSIILSVERLKLVGVFQHTNDAGAWAAFLYVAHVDPSLWVIQNCEPEKFEDWKWAPWDKAIEAVRADTHDKWTMHEVFGHIMVNADRSREERKPGYQTHCFSCLRKFPCGCMVGKG